MRRLQRRARLLGALAGLSLAAGLLSSCGESGKPVLNWYINPDGQETLQALADKCSTADYDIEIQLLPTGATDQRIQLARRLAASDDTTDLMSLDPVFVPEFANAKWLEPLPEETASEVVDDDVLKGPADTVAWDDRVYAFPQWANTQVLWYRKSLAEKAGLDVGPDQNVTWQQVIDAASKTGGTVGVQADRYEAYVVLINSLIQGAGGDIVSDTEAGKDAKIDIDSDAGRAAAQVIESLASSKAAQPDLSVSREGTVLPYMYAGVGEFMTNWTFTYANYRDTVSKEELADLGYARYPQTVEGEDSRPPVGGIDIAVSAFSKHTDFALQAAQCVSSPDAQEQLAVKDGLMPSRASVYGRDALAKAFPADLLELWRTSLEDGGARPKSAYYATISSAVQSSWSSPGDVDADTPQKSAQFLEDVLEGKALL